jgi:tRNA pseudouridine55 synthase
MEFEKEYLGTIRLGIETDTDDLTGEVLSRREDSSISQEAVEEVARGFVGQISQHPPRVSALKQRGRRFYDMARRGESFETEAREVMIYDFRLHAFRFPELDFSLRCSKGTYVRALARDLGRKLGCGAHLSALRRTRVGPFAAEDSVSLDGLREMVESVGHQLDTRSVASMEEALAFLPAFSLRSGEEQGILYGQSPSLSQFEVFGAEVGANQNVRILSSQGALLAIGKTPAPGAEPIVRLERVLVATNG